MSKTITTNLKNHLAQDVTSVCTCWNLIRTDGQAFYFTDHDSDIIFGGNQYSSSKGYVRTAISSDEKMTVDNMEVFGILNMTFIDEHDLRNGVYDHASVEIFLVNWLDLSQGKLTLRKGRFGEITVTPTGSFKTEIRGLSQALAVNFGEVISSQCRADFGDTKCKVPVEPPVWLPSTTYAADSYVRASNMGTMPDDPAGGFIWHTVAGGMSGTIQPPWLGSPAAYPPVTVTDNTITWIPYNSFTKQGQVVYVANRKRIKVSGLLIPQNQLYGPFINTLGNVYSLGTIPLPGSIYIFTGGFPSSAPTNTLTCDITLTGSNTLQFGITGIPGAGDIITSSGNNTNHVHFTGTLESINAVLQMGITWTNSASFNDTIRVAATDTHGHSFNVTWSLPQVTTYYANATLVWITGENAGKAMEVHDYGTDDFLNFWLSMPFIPAIGDVFRIYPGCDKSRVACRNYGNGINFRGEPDLPGQDFLFAPNLSF